MKRAEREDGATCSNNDGNHVSHSSTNDMKVEEDAHIGDSTSSSSQPSIIVLAGTDPEQWPHIILRGSTAGLSPLRHAKIRDEFFVGPRALLVESNGMNNGIPCRVEGLSDHTTMGDVYITLSQLVFVSTGTSTSTTASASVSGVSQSLTESEACNLEEDDWAIGATCIHLHALAEEPEPSIYLQLAEEGQDDSTLEVTLTPLDHDACQLLFDGLCKLVAKHPLQLDDQDDNPGPGWGDTGDAFVDEDDGDENDDMIWAPSSGWGAGVPDLDEDEEDDDGGGATEEERAAMLARLDKLLVVHPSLQGHEGQFDDADETANDPGAGRTE